MEELDLGYRLPTPPALIKADNQGAIALTKDPRFHTRTKYIDIQWHFVRDQVTVGAVSFEYIPTNEMAADGLTKPLNRANFDRFVMLIGMKE